MNGQTDGWKSPCDLQDFIPFWAATQKPETLVSAPTATGSYLNVCRNRVKIVLEMAVHRTLLTALSYPTHCPCSPALYSLPTRITPPIHPKQIFIGPVSGLAGWIDNCSRHFFSLSISTLLGLSNLVGHYRGAVKFMSMGPSVTVDLTVRSVTLEVDVQLQFRIRKSTARAHPLMRHDRLYGI